MASPFWTYFRDALGWALIQTPGPLAAIAKGVALVMDDVRQDIFWLREQCNPATCEESYLARHAEARGLERHPLESMEQFRQRVVRAYLWHSKGGKARGMPEILSHYGYAGCSMDNCRHDDPARWAEFMPRIPVPEHGLGNDDYALIAWVVGETKPARSKLAGLRTQAKAHGAVNAAGTVIAGTRVFLGPETPETAVLDTSVHHAATLQTVTYTTLEPSNSV